MAQVYTATAIAAADPGSCVLYEVEPDQRFRAELIALHVLMVDPAADPGPLILPVPLSMYRAGLDLGELAHLLDDQLWEVRLADTEAMLARLDEIRPCGRSCTWTTEETTDDAGSLDFVMAHGADCGPTLAALEAAA